jgi:hypothetical protein
MNNQKSQVDPDKRTNLREKFVSKHLLQDETVEEYIHCRKLLGGNIFSWLNISLQVMGILLFISGSAIAIDSITIYDGFPTFSEISSIIGTDDIYIKVFLFILISIVLISIMKFINIVKEKIDELGISDDDIYYHFIAKSMENYDEGDYGQCYESLAFLKHSNWLRSPLSKPHDTILNGFIKGVDENGDQREEIIRDKFAKIVEGIAIDIQEYKTTTFTYRLHLIELEADKPEPKIPQSRFRYAKALLSENINLKRYKGLLIYVVIAITGIGLHQLFNDGVITVVIVPTAIAFAHYLNNNIWGASQRERGDS